MARGTSRSAMDAIELAYAQQIYLHNDDVVVGGTTPPLISKMLDMAASLNDEVSYTDAVLLVLLSVRMHVCAHARVYAYVHKERFNKKLSDMGC